MDRRAAGRLTPMFRDVPLSHRIAAAAVAALLLLSLGRTCGVGADVEHAAGAPASPSVPDETARVDAGGGAERGSALLRLEMQVEVPWDRTGPPLVLRVRPRDGASRTFDVTVRDEAPRQQTALVVELPVREPEPPLRVELAGETWCFPPGLRELEVVRLDAPMRMVIARARSLEVALVADETRTPVALAELVHAGGTRLATSDAQGRASLLRPRRTQPDPGDLLLALAPGRAPALVPEDAGENGSVTLPLRPDERGGTVRGRVLDPFGAPVAGAWVTPHHDLAGEPPEDPAARAVFDALDATRRRDVPALARRTGDDGAFELPAPWPAFLTIRARHRQLGAASVELAPDRRAAEAGRVTEVELRFPPSFHLVVAASRAGAPLPAFAIELVHDAASPDSTLAAAASGPDGRAELTAPALAPLWLVARAAGLAPALVQLPAELAPTHEVGIELERGRDLAFELGPRADAAGVAVFVQLLDAQSRITLHEARVDAAGRVRFEGVPSGRPLELSAIVADRGGPVVLREFSLDRAEPAAGDATLVDLGIVPWPDDRR